MDGPLTAPSVCATQPIRAQSRMLPTLIRWRDVVSFMANGHVLLRNVVPRVRKRRFQDEVNAALVPAEKRYLVHALQKLGCEAMIQPNDVSRCTRLRAML